jgi:hypothetical protein
MDLTHAQDEATTGRLTDQQAIWLAAACRCRSERLGLGGVREHAIEYPAAKWPEVATAVGNGKSITRGQILDIADGPAIDVFTASYLFGKGKRGYGRSRYDRIRAASPNLSDVLERVREIGLRQGPIVAYAQLYGGQDYEHRSRPDVAPWSRIAGYGPAFFTKLLYFAVPGALFDLDASALPARRQDSAVATDHTDGYDDGEATDW